MIPFEIEKVEIKHVWLKSCTTALGGSISIVDESRSSETKEVLTKVSVPLAAVRKFVKTHSISKYLKPVLTAVTFYDGHAVAIERHPLGSLGQEVVEGLSGERHWESESERNLDRYLMPLTRSGNWYTDGTFVYSVRESDLQAAEFMSRDGKFRSVRVQAIKLADIGTAGSSIPQERTCLQYVAATGEKFITSPIWKSLSAVGTAQLGRADDDGEAVDLDDDDDGEASINSDATETAFQFDRIDQFLSVNLSFVLKAGREIANIFGYDSIEPLQLDNLMVQLRTVNLPTVDKSVKQTFDSGLPFTHAIAWLIGLTRRTETLESYMVLRSLLKHLTTKGVYRKGAFRPEAVYKENMNMSTVPSKTIEEAAQPIDQFTMSTIMEMSNLFNLRGNGEEVGAIGTLFGAE